MANAVNEKFMSDLALRKLAPYLYEVNFAGWDYTVGSDYFEKYHNPIIGACSAVRNGDFYGRNYDWYLDECASFVIRCKKSKFKHGSIGIAGSNTSLTEAVVSSGKYNPSYKLLPFLTVDGINDKGVACNVNVVPTGDKGYTTGSNPAGKDMCATMIVRYILDYADSAAHGVELIKGLNVYMPISDEFTQEFHWMIADKERTYVVEFLHNTINVISDVRNDNCGSFPNDKPIMTNFYLSGFDGNTATKFYKANEYNAGRTTLTNYAAGLERYDILSSGYAAATDKESMVDLMRSVIYSKAYEAETNPFWFSEFVGDLSSYGYGDLSINSDTEDFQPLIEHLQDLYSEKQRNRKLWQTVHTSIYDLEHLKLYVFPQETTDEFSFTLRGHRDNDEPYEEETENGKCHNQILNNMFVQAMKREHKSVTAFTTGAKFDCFFRKNNDTTNERDTMIMFYSVDAPVDVGTLINYGGNTYLALNKETAENNVYYKSAIIQTNGKINTHNLTVSDLPFYGDGVNNATASNTIQISTIDGNIEILTEDNNLSRQLQINDMFNEWGRTWKISNLMFIDGLCHIILEVHENVTPTYEYRLELSALEFLNVEPDDVASISVTAYCNDNRVEAPTITYSSSNPDVATIDGNGNIVYLSDGEVYFTALWEEQNISESTDTVTVLSVAEDDTIAIYVDRLDEICYGFPETLHYYATRGGIRDDTIPVSFKIENLSVSGATYLKKITITDNGNGTVDVDVSGSVMLGKTFDFVAYNDEFGVENRQNVKVISLF